MKSILKIFFLFLIFHLGTTFPIGAQNDWIQVDGMYNTRINNLFFTQEDMFVTTALSKSFISHDLGLNWEKTNHIQSLAVLGSTIFIIGRVDFYFGLQYSTDNGNTWHIVSSTPETFYSIGSNDNFIFANSNNGLYKSDDGFNWYHIDSLSYAYSGAKFNVCNEKLLYSNYYSADNGTTWIQLLNPDGGTYGMNSTVTLTNAGLFMPYNNGIYNSQTPNHWVKINTDNISDEHITNCYFADSIMFITTSNGLFYLNNSDSTWLKYNNFPYSPIKGSITKGNNHFFLRTDIGLFGNDSIQGEWIDRTPKENDCNVKGFVVDNNIIASISKCKLFLSKDFGNNWETIPIEFDGNTNAPIVHYQDNIVISTAKGLYSYNLITNSLSCDTLTPYFSEMKVHDNKIFGVSIFGVFYTDFNSSTWSQLPNMQMHCYDITFNGNYIYVLNYQQGVVVSSNFGSSWDSLNTGLQILSHTGGETFLLPRKIKFIDKLYSVTQYDNYYYLAYYNQTLSSWIDSLIIPTSIIEADYDFFDFGISESTVYLATTTGVHYFDRNLSSWEDISGEITLYGEWIAKECTQLSFSNNEIFVSVKDAGIWRRNSISSYQIPSELTVFPNPANDFVTVNGNSEITHISVYKIDGQKIIDLENNNYSATINTSDLQNGTYLIQISTLDETMMKMFQILK